ncbi:uncharacterized protein LOC133923574 [Phragmites australis]|uniref:uncharacterized protein LOC133923574 n=1 Tax=Phragmites australis TaxID=29695 RepID=UPI002D78FA66|nr:uncharacterized protein LOC133923574 [Phragmites australis]
MERGERQKVDPVPNEAERRQLKARRDYEIVTEQFWPLMEKIDEWLEQHRAPEGLEETQASDVEDGASPVQTPSEGLADTIRRFLRELDGSDEASGSGQATYQKPEVAPTDPKTEASPP